MRVGEGGEAVADVRDVHGSDVFEERDKGNELLVGGGAGPGGQDDGVAGLEGGVFGGGVEDYGAGEGPVEVCEVLERMLGLWLSERGEGWVKRGRERGEGRVELGGRIGKEGGERGKYLDIFAVFVPCCFAEQRPLDDAVGIQFADYRVGRHGR